MDTHEKHNDFHRKANAFHTGYSVKADTAENCNENWTSAHSQHDQQER